MKKDAPLWMRTRAQGRCCLKATALGASVRRGAHFFMPQGQRQEFFDLANKNHKKYVDLCLNQVYDWAWKSRITWMQA